MLHRYSFRSLLVAVSLVACCTNPAMAALLVDLPIPEEGPGDPTTDAQCLLGETRAGNIANAQVMEAGAKFYQLLRPSACLACELVYGRAIQSGVMRLRFLSGCDIVMRVQIVAATGGPGCYAPDTTIKLCPPTMHTLSEPASQFVTKNYTMPINGCCIMETAYLSLEVVSTTCAANEIAMPFASGGCTACTQYIVHPTLLGPNIEEQCAGGFGRNYRMWSEVDCCGAVPTETRSWGRIKTIYR